MFWFCCVLLKGIRLVEGDTSAKPPQGLLPRYGHSLLDEARAEIRNLWVLPITRYNLYQHHIK